MHSSRTVLHRRLATLRFLLLAAIAVPLCATVIAGPILWDTQTAPSEANGNPDKSGWKRVPTDLFKLENDPATASSDPGYYGREYMFKGDAAIENSHIIAIVNSTRGSLQLYVKGAGAESSAALVRPVAMDARSLVHVSIVRNAGDQVILQAAYGSGEVEQDLQYAFGNDAVVEVRPTEGIKSFLIEAPLENAIVPGFVGDDLLYSLAEQKGELNIPMDSMFLGLLGGENSELVMTWPRGNQRLRITPAEKGEKEALRTIAFANDGQSFFLAPLAARGIWHREPLNASWLERDMKLNWTKPFPAKWETQLSEAGVKTRFAFHDAKGTVWRGVPGSYDYPVWFEGGDAMAHLSKKVPPRGDALVYFIEGQDTPEGIATPAGILRETLGRSAADAIMDTAGQKLRTHHRRGADGVRRACTCGCTEAIQACFEAGNEVARKEYIAQALDDMIYFVQRHMERIDEYRHFADETIKALQAKEKESPELKDYIEDMLAIVNRIPDEYNNQLENMKSLSYARELAAKTTALTGTHDAQNLASYMELLKAWRGMGGAQDYIVAQCHVITRELFQQAGYGIASQPKGLALAMDLRTRCHAILRNPDGYEIWPNY